MSTDIQSLYDKCDELINSGLDKDQIFKKLNLSNLPKDQIKKVLFYLDDRFSEIEMLKQQKSTYFQFIVMGVFLLLFGFGITVGTFLLGASKFIFAFGSIFSGAYLIKEGYRNYKTPPPLPRRKSIFRNIKSNKW